MQNTFTKSFNNGRLRDECLNETWFWALAGARVTIGQWRVEFNTACPHSGLASRTASEYASELTQVNNSLHDWTQELGRRWGHVTKRDGAWSGIR